MNNFSFAINLGYSSHPNEEVQGQLIFSDQDQTALYAGKLSDGESRYTAKSFKIYPEEIQN